jgi:integrase
MPTIALTDVAIRALKSPASGQATFFDKKLRGFGVRVSQGGTKSFVVVHGPSRRRKTIGRYPMLSLAKARGEAKRLLAEQTLGIEAAAPSLTYKEALSRYLEAVEAKNRESTVASYRRHLNRHFKFGASQLSEITTDMLLQRISRLRSTPGEQQHAYIAVKIFFNWCVKSRLLEQSPLQNVPPPRKPRPRIRVLSEAELAAVYQTALEYSFPFGAIVALLVLTGQRRSEIASLEWGWINEKEQLITIPAEITKNRHEHTFPYGEQVATVIAGVPRLSDAYLFPAARLRSERTTVFNGWGKAKQQFDEACGVSDWTLHDLRRTFVSTLGYLQVPIHVSERLVNHASGTFGGIVSVYNRYSYLAEMRDAVKRLERHLARQQATM